MATVKMFKILNLSAAAGLVAKDGDKLIVKANDAYGKVSLAPSWGSAVMWADTLSELAEFKIPEREKWVFIAEVELDASAMVEGCYDALHLDEAEFVKMEAGVASSKLTYKGWTCGPYTKFYGVRPEVRVDGPVEIRKLYKIKKKDIRRVMLKAPDIDYDILYNYTEEDLERMGSEFCVEVKNLKKSLIPSSYEEMMESLDTSIEVNNEVPDKIDSDSWHYSEPPMYLAAVIAVQNGSKLSYNGDTPTLTSVLHDSLIVQKMYRKEYPYYDYSNKDILRYADKLPDAVELLRIHKDPLKVLEELEKLL